MNDNLANLNQARQTSATTTFISVFVTVFLLTVIIATAVTFILPEIYESSCRIMISSAAAHISTATNNSPHHPIARTIGDLISVAEIICSRDFASNVVSRLELDKKWGNKYQGGRPVEFPESCSMFISRLRVRPLANSEIIEMSFFSEDRKEAAEVVNAVPQIFQETLFQLTPLARTGSKIEVLDKAEPSAFPVRPNKTLNIVIGMFVGIILGSIAGALAVRASTSRTNRLKKSPVV